MYDEQWQERRGDEWRDGRARQRSINRSAHSLNQHKVRRRFVRDPSSNVSVMSVPSALSPVRSVSAFDASDTVVIPPLTSSEAENVTALMAEFGVDYAHLDVLESRLASKLTALDHECVDIVMSAKSRSDSASIVDRVESYCVTLDEMSLWLHHHDGELTRMRRGIELIESRNIALDTAERNFARLRDTLAALIDRITLPPHIERTLVRADWTNTAAIVNAARALADITSQRLDPRLETLSAVVQQRAAMQTLQAQFARDAVRFVQSALPAAAARRGEVAADAPSIGDTRIESNGAMHSDVSRHGELIALVRRFDVGALALLLSAYTSVAQKRSEANVKAFAAAVKRIVTTDRAVPPSHLLSQADFSVGSGRRYAAQSNRASCGAVYRLFIRSLSAVVIEEQTFLANVFFAETPAAEAAAAANTATETIFRCLLGEANDLVTAAIKFDPLSSLDVSTAIQANSDERTPPPVARIVDSIQKSSATAFAEFVDGEIAALNNLKFAPKQAGILPPVNKFPSLLDRIDAIAAANKSAAADAALMKLVNALSKWIEQIAKSDEKYGDVLRHRKRALSHRRTALIPSAAECQLRPLCRS